MVRFPMIVTYSELEFKEGTPEVNVHFLEVKNRMSKDGIGKFIYLVVFTT